MLSCSAAVLKGTGEPLVVENVTVGDPGHGEVLLKIDAVGICGSDRFVLEGHYPVEVPCVCGHEGSGTVVAVGPGVHDLAVGDRVVQTFVGSCGRCRHCRRGRGTFCEFGSWSAHSESGASARMWDAAGEPIKIHLGLGSFSEYTVTPRRNCIPISNETPPEVAALVACGVSTGVGAVINVARVQPGDSVLVVGFGGVGAAALLGALVAGAGQVIVADVDQVKLQQAVGLGASDVIDVRSVDLAEGVVELTGGLGVDAAVLTPTRVNEQHYRDAVAAIGPCGVVVHVGGVAQGLDHIPVSPGALLSQQKSIVGTVFGGSDPARDVSRWIGLHRAGRLPLERLITRTYSLHGINDAFEDLIAGRNLRGVVTMAPPSDAC